MNKIRHEPRRKQKKVLFSLSSVYVFKPFIFIIFKSKCRCTKDQTYARTHLPLLATSHAISKRTASSKSNSSSHSSSPDKDVADRLRASGMLGRHRTHLVEMGATYNCVNTIHDCDILNIFTKRLLMCEQFTHGRGSRAF